MIKIVCALQRPDGMSETGFRQRLNGPVAEKLLAAGVRGLQVNVADEAVRPAARTRQVNSHPAADGLACLWVVAEQAWRPLEAILLEACRGVAAYEVEAHEPLLNTQQRVAPGQRTPGYSQVVFLQKPPRLSREQWLDLWLNRHTPVAIETQASFRYVQNVIRRPLGCAAPAWDAVVEECFPAAAMTDPMAFYDARGDEARFRVNQQRMIESCMRFIDFDRLNVIPTSEYVIRRP